MMTGKETTKGGFLKDSSFYLSATGVSAILGFVTLPIYTRFLSPIDYGVVVLFAMFGQVTSGLLSLGIQGASYRYYFEYKNNKDEYKILNSTNLLYLLLVFLFGGLCIYFLANMISSMLFDSKISGQLIRMSFVYGCLNYFVNYFMFMLTAQLRSVTFATMTISQALIKIVFSLYFIFFHSLTYLALIYASLITQGILVFCLIFLCSDTIGIRYSLFSLKKSLRFSYPMFLRLIIGVTHQSFDRIILTNYTGLVSVGYYEFGGKFANILKLVMDSVGKAWQPFFFNKAHEHTKEAEKAIIDRFFDMSYLFILVGLGIVYFSEEMVKLLTTKEFYPAMYVVPVYVFYYLVGILGMLSVSQIQFAEKTLYLLPASITSVVLNIILNLLLIPHFGALGAVAALVIAAVFSSMVHMYFGFKFYPLQLGIWKLVKLFLLAIAFTAPGYLIMAVDMHFITKIMIKLIMLFLFIGVGLKFDYISRENIQIIRKALNPFLQLDWRRKKYIPGAKSNAE